MNRATIAAFALLLFAALPRAQDARPDGVNEVLAVVNGHSITYQQIVGDSDMQAEINTFRTLFLQQRGPSEDMPLPATDAQIERMVVHQRLPGFVLQRLLDLEAEKVNFAITESQMRLVLQRERSALRIAEEDSRAWARYLKERFNLTPAEYRSRRRQELVRLEVMNLMAGAYGPLPPVYPLEIYFAMSVTPRDLRREFDKDRERFRFAYDIDFREFRLLWPQDTSFENREKLRKAVTDTKTGVRYRVEFGRESLESACDGLLKLLPQVAGARLELTPRRVAADDTELDPVAYEMVMSLPATGGVSDEGSLPHTDPDGSAYQGLRFVQLFKCRFGEEKTFEDPKVQEGIRARLSHIRLQENRQKVEQELFRKAAIVPEDWFKR